MGLERYISCINFILILQKNVSLNLDFPCEAEKTGIMTQGVDYKWVYEDGKTSYADELNLVCSPAKLDLIFSIIFAGAPVGLLVSSFTVDLTGRKKAILGHSAIIAVVTVASKN